MRGAMRQRGRPHGIAFALGGAQRRVPHALQQSLHGALAAGHGVQQLVVGEAGLAMQARLLVAQAQDALRDGAVVGLARVFAAPHPGTPGLLAQIAPRAEGQEGDDVRAAQAHKVVARRQAAFSGRLAHHGARELRQAGQLGLAAQHQLVAGLVGHHVLGKAGVELGQLLHQFGAALPLGGTEARAGTHRLQVQALEQATCLRVQAQRVDAPQQIVQAREHALVHGHPAGMGGQRCRHAALHGLQLGRGARGIERVEKHFHPTQPATAGVERRSGVGKARRLRVGRDGVELGALRGHGSVEGRLEVFGTHHGKGRQAALGCTAPVAQQRVH
jgi:uncharacterized Zn-binding protein involved in type VI secretion